MKKKIKITILWLAKYGGLFALCRLLTRNGFAVIGWHGVSIEDEHRRIPSYWVSPETLRRRLAHLSKHFRIVSLDEVLRQHAEGRIRPRQVVLTYDDGLYCFAASAVPVMREFDAAATLFVVSSKMEPPTQGYGMVIRDMFQLTPLQEVHGLPGLPGQRYSLRTPADRQACTRSCRTAFDRLPPGDDAQDHFIRQLGRDLRVDADQLLRRRSWDHLTTDEVRQLSQQGYDMQVHTHSHQTVVEHPDSVFEEAQRCRSLIEQATQKPAVDYCYPSGLWRREAWQPLRQAGMRSGLTCKLGPNFTSTPPLALRRYIDHEGISQLEFEALVSGFRWLVHVLLHPRRFAEPSEALHEDGSLF